jgi:hypothetical protein
MALEDEYPDVLQNIEFAIVSVYREKSDLYDFSVMRALDAHPKISISLHRRTSFLNGQKPFVRCGLDVMKGLKHYWVTQRRLMSFSLA